MDSRQVILITGTSRGIGKYLAEYYAQKGLSVAGCSRRPIPRRIKDYRHFCLDVSDEQNVIKLFAELRRTYQRLDILINNAGIASMNHMLLTPVKTVHKILNTNFVGTFLFCREAAKLMKKNNYGRIVNFTTVATPLKIEGEAIYASSKAAVVSLTQIIAKELSNFGITVNAIGPAPLKTDLLRSVPEDKINSVIRQQAIHRMAEFRDISNVVDFFIRPESDFITGQSIYLGGV